MIREFMEGVLVFFIFMAFIFALPFLLLNPIAPAALPSRYRVEIVKK